MRFVGMLCTLIVLWAAVQAEEPAAKESKKLMSSRAPHPDAMTPQGRQMYARGFCRKLERRASCHFVDTPLQEVLVFIQTLATSGIHLSPGAATAGAAQVKITHQCRNIPLALMLDDVLARHGLEWTIFKQVEVCKPDRIRELSGKYPEMAKVVANLRKRMQDQVKPEREKAIIEEGR